MTSPTAVPRTAPSAAPSRTSALSPSAHVDTFARDRLPPADAQPEYLSTCPSCSSPRG
jgi:hypothetical protein